MFAHGLDDGWAAFARADRSYAWLSEEDKRARFLALIGALEAIEADVQILRVCRRWELERYARTAARGQRARGSTARARTRRPRALHRGAQSRASSDVGVAQPVVFLLVSLREPERDVASYVSRAAAQHPQRVVARRRRALALRDRRVLSASELERARVRADQAHARLADFLPVRPARGVELQWLVRRAFCSGLGEPRRRRPARAARARVRAQRRGGAGAAGGRRDALGRRLRRAPGQRCSRSSPSCGTSWQAQLVLGALPERMQFPGARAELMFAPAESLPFAIDLSLNARFLPNELALRIARRRIQDADQIVRAESGGEQGVSDLGLRAHAGGDGTCSPTCRRRAGRRCCARRSRSRSRRASEEELEERVEMCRRAYGEIRLHRPLGDQLQLFLQHLPGQRTRLAGYDDTLTAEQVAAMMPTAAHAAGSDAGFYLGHTLSGSRQPVALQPAGGLGQRPQHDDPQRRRARLGQDDARAEAPVRGVPAGREGDRLRSQGRPPLPPARRRWRRTSSA